MLLQSAWGACQASEAKHERAEILGQMHTQDAEPPSARELNAMDDNAVARLYHDSLRAYAKSIRGAGIVA